MLTIIVPAGQRFDETEQRFVSCGNPTVLQLEHSLLSISKWETRFKKPFISSNKTADELLYYIECMIVSPKTVNSDVLLLLTEDNLKDINDYIGDNKTATWFRNAGKKSAQRVMTSELIYAQMVILRIPFECQKWHLSRLLTLIRVVVEEQTPKKKMSSKDVARQNRELNAARLKRLGTKG